MGPTDEFLVVLAETTVQIDSGADIGGSAGGFEEIDIEVGHGYVRNI